MSNDEARWKAVQDRDKAADGTFLYGVATTGVFCKPSCGSRRALRKNVSFYLTAMEAECAGLRPCKRCRPVEPANAEGAADTSIRRTCKFIKDHVDENLGVEALAIEARMSVAHFHRHFKRLVGVTPKQYLDGLRMDALKRRLRGGAAVTESIYESGYRSNSRVYERSDTQLGMTPAEYGRGAAGVTISYASVPSPLGRMMLGATDRGLCFVQFGENHQGLLAMLQKEYPLADLQAMTKPYHPHFGNWIGQLDRYLRGTETALSLPVDVQATAFQLRVWRYLQTIPYGKKRSYQEVAKDLGEPAAVRAVAGACARNRVALLVPCHRVVRNNGALGGYRWGLDRKRALLELEQSGEHASHDDYGKGANPSYEL